MINLSAIIHQIIQSQLFFNMSIGIALTVKCYLLTLLITQGLKHKTNRTSWLLLLTILTCSILGDLSWIIKITRMFFFPALPYGVTVFSIRIAWAALIVQYQSLALFIESLTKKKYSLDSMHKLIVTISGLFAGYFVYLAFIDTSLTTEIERSAAFALKESSVAFEVMVMKYVSMYLLPVIIFPSLYFAFRNIKHQQLPKILKRQLTILIKYLLCPFLIAEFIIALELNVQSLGVFQNGLLSISTLLMSVSLYYCITTIISLRFLNFQQQLQAKQRVNFINNFKEILDQLSKIKNHEELNQIVQTFFHEAFDIPPKKTTLYIRTNPDQPKQSSPQPHASSLEKYIEEFMLHHHADMCTFIGSSKILIHDDLSFNAFYQDNPLYKDLMIFIESINADIFVPIYQKNKMIAYIIVELNAREKLYSTADRDEMIILSNYISIVINLLYHRNLDLLIAYEKDLKEELFFKHQEISQYKESMRSFLGSDPYKKSGILFYKNGHFIFGNKAAQEMIAYDINNQEGHPLTKSLKTIGYQVETYKIPQTELYYGDDKKIVLSAMLNLEKNNVIIIMYYPEIADIIKKQASLLKAPGEWDYLLYLETTAHGQLVSAAIPGTSEPIIHFKIQLMKVGLSKKASLIEAHPDDVSHIVELIHAMSLKSMLHIIRLKEQIKEKNYVIKLFGINPLLGMKMADKPLMEKLDKNGTLFIENIHLLDFDTQEHLAEYLKMGYFRLFKSEQKIFSSVRILCSTNQNLAALVAEGKFSNNLFIELKKSMVSAPSMLSLTAAEFNDMIDDIIAQNIRADNFKNMLELTEKDRAKLLAIRSLSFTELKKKIKNLLITKSKKNNMYQDVQFEPAQISGDQQLLQASRLGKYALKDQKTMSFLWEKFKNQNKMAKFLGVNRSSVNRRCKEFNLE